jgi:hypothetical protein
MWITFKIRGSSKDVEDYIKMSAFLLIDYLLHWQLSSTHTLEVKT